MIDLEIFFFRKLNNLKFFKKTNYFSQKCYGLYFALKKKIIEND